MRKIVITGSEGLIGSEVSSYFEGRGDEVFRCGESEIEFNFAAKELQIQYQDETGEKLDIPENVIKVDFGKEQ